MTNEPLYLGVDLGGTQLRMAAVTRAGQPATEVLSIHTGKTFTPDHLCEQISRLMADLQSQAGEREFAALGIGVTGIVRQGRLSGSDFLPLLNDLDFPAILSPLTDCPVTVENDARCFVLAEARFGAGRGAQNICGITLGTGVGGGLIVDGRLVHGATAQGGEVWSIPLRDKHLEYFLSGDGVVRGYLKAGGKHDEASDCAPGRAPDSALIADLARRGDAAAQAAWTSFGADLYLLCGTMIALLDPEMIVIGGSLALARDLYIDQIIARLSHRSTRIVFAELGRAAGVIGAAALNIE